MIHTTDNLDLGDGEMLRANARANLNILQGQNESKHNSHKIL